MLLEPCDFRVIRWPTFKAGDIVKVGYHRTSAVIVWIEDNYARLWWFDDSGQDGYPNKVPTTFLSPYRG